jgi:hypothetical protein
MAERKRRSTQEMSKSSDLTHGLYHPIVIHDWLTSTTEKSISVNGEEGMPLNPRDLEI